MSRVCIFALLYHKNQPSSHGSLHMGSATISRLFGSNFISTFRVRSVQRENRFLPDLSSQEIATDQMPYYGVGCPAGFVILTIVSNTWFISPIYRTYKFL